MWWKFVERIKNRRQWFRYSDGISAIEGRKLQNQSLELTIKFHGEWITVSMDRDSALKLKDWLGRTYPGRGENNVIAFSNKSAGLATVTPFPLPKGPRDTDPDPGVA